MTEKGDRIMNMKQLCAKEALKYIKDGMCIGLGGGSTIGYLAEYLAKEERKITVVTRCFLLFSRQSSRYLR